MSMLFQFVFLPFTRPSSFALPNALSSHAADRRLANAIGNSYVAQRDAMRPPASPTGLVPARPNVLLYLLFTTASSSSEPLATLATAQQSPLIPLERAAKEGLVEAEVVALISQNRAQVFWPT